MIGITKRFLTRPIYLGASVVVIAALLPLFLPNVLVPIMITFFVYACVACSWNLIMGYAGQISLGQTLFLGIGAYASAVLFMRFHISPWLGMWVGVAISIVLATFLGYLCFRYKVRGGYFAVATLAFGQIGYALVITFPALGGAAELQLPITQKPVDFQFASTIPFYFIGLVLLLGIGLFSFFVRRTKMGYYFRAIRESEDAAEAAGVDLVKYKTIAFIFSAFFTSIVGTYYIQYLGGVVAESVFGLEILIIAVLATVIGGLGTAFGPILGAAFVVLVSTICRWYLGQFAGVSASIYAILLILVILYMPHGIMEKLEKLEKLGRRLAGRWVSSPTKVNSEACSAVFTSSLPCIKSDVQSSHLLKVEGITKSFGGLMAVNDLSFEVKPGEILGLIGPNGAGKTTAFNLISGFIAPDKGKIIFDGKDITKMRSHQVASLGIARTFQLTQPLSNLTTVENVMIGAFIRHSKPSLVKDKAINVLRALGIADKANVLSKDLTLVEQRRLEIARAVATEPKLILLDESMSGLTPTETKAAIELIRQLKGTGITFIVVEHVMPVIMGLAERIVVMHLGQKIAEGMPEEIVKNRKAVEAYLGEEIFIA